MEPSVIILLVVISFLGYLAAGYREARNYWMSRCKDAERQVKVLKSILKYRR